MKQRATWVGILAFVVLGSTVQTASAFSQTHGSAFHAYNASEVTSIDYLTNGVRNIAAGPRYVIAPIAFSPPSNWAGGNAPFRVDGQCAAGTNLSYTMYGYSYKGVLQASQNILQGGAPFDTYVALNPLDVSSYVTLLTQLPANTGTMLYGVQSAF